jgi:hypothetical protein
MRKINLSFNFVDKLNFNTIVICTTIAKQRDGKQVDNFAEFIQPTLSLVLYGHADTHGNTHTHTHKEL